MKMSQMPYSAENSKQQLVGFGGINFSPRYKPGDLLNCENLSADEYPWISQRKNTAIAYTYTTDTPTGTYTSPVAIYAKDKMCIIDSDGKFYYDGTEITGHTFDVTNDIQMVTVNTKIMIFPEAWYYDTEESKLVSFGNIEWSVTTISNSGSPPYLYFIVADDYLQLYNTVSSVSFLNFTDGNGNINCFKVGDKLSFSFGVYDYSGTVTSITGSRIDFQTGDLNAGAGYLCHNGSVITFKRVVMPIETGETPPYPMFDYVCESNNRLWGVNNTKQIIYGSALGYPTDFTTYAGLSTDAYAVAVGSAGDFTACIGYGSTICFFKENIIHKLYGSKPSNYQIVTSIIPGVESGASKSLQIIKEVLYYKGRLGVYAYTGGIPSLISDNFGTVEYDESVAGTDGNKYYISMATAADNTVYDFYTYDTLRGIWIRNGSERIIDFAYLDGYMYYLEYIKPSTTQLNRIYQTGTGTEIVSWSAELCPFYENTQQRKSYLRLYLRYQPAEVVTGGTLNIYKKVVGVDSDYVLALSIGLTAVDEKTIIIPLPPNRCDSFMIKLTGVGKCYIKSLIREYQMGSEI